MDERERYRWSRWLFASLLMVAGLIVFAIGCYLETHNPRSTDEDDFALHVLGIGVSLIAAGSSIPFQRLPIVILITFVSPYLAWSLAGFAYLLLVFWYAVFVTVFGS